MIAKSLTRIVAHRGAAAGDRRKENVLSSYIEAYKTYSAAECDIQRTQDQKLVLWHDHTLNGEAQAKGCTKNLSQCIADFSYDALRAVLPITLVSDVLQALPQNKELFIEIKLPDLPIVSILLEILKRYSAPERVVLISFHAVIVGQLKKLAPEYRVLLLSDRDSDMDDIIKTAAQCGANGVGIEYVPGQEKTFIDTIQKLQEKKYLIQVWNLLLSPSEEMHLLSLANRLKIQYCNVDYFLKGEIC